MTEKLQMFIIVRKKMVFFFNMQCSFIKKYPVHMLLTVSANATEVKILCYGHSRTDVVKV